MPLTRDTAPVVLARRMSSHPSGWWEARRSIDRGRLEVVCVIRTAAGEIEIALPTQQDLQALLEDYGTDEWGRAV